MDDWSMTKPPPAQGIDRSEQAALPSEDQRVLMDLELRQRREQYRAAVDGNRWGRRLPWDAPVIPPDPGLGAIEEAP